MLSERDIKIGAVYRHNKDSGSKRFGELCVIKGFTSNPFRICVEFVSLKSYTDLDNTFVTQDYSEAWFMQHMIVDTHIMNTGNEFMLYNPNSSRMPKKVFNTLYDVMKVKKTWATGKYCTILRRVYSGPQKDVVILYPGSIKTGYFTSDFLKSAVTHNKAKIFVEVSERSLIDRAHYVLNNLRFKLNSEVVTSICSVDPLDDAVDAVSYAAKNIIVNENENIEPGVYKATINHCEAKTIANGHIALKINFEATEENGMHAIKVLKIKNKVVEISNEQAKLLGGVGNHGLYRVTTALRNGDEVYKAEEIKMTQLKKKK